MKDYLSIREEQTYEYILIIREKGYAFGKGYADS